MNKCYECQDLRRELASLRAERDAAVVRAERAEWVARRIEYHMLDQETDMWVVVPSSDTPGFSFPGNLFGFDFAGLAAEVERVHGVMPDE